MRTDFYMEKFNISLTLIIGIVELIKDILYIIVIVRQNRTLIVKINEEWLSNYLESSKRCSPLKKLT